MFDDIIGVSPPAKPGRRMNFVDRFHIIITELMKMNLESRGRITSNIMTLPMFPMFAYEYCTIKVHIGRRTGKTEYIRRYATKHDAVIVAQEQQKKTLFPNGIKAALFSAGELKSEFEAGDRDFSKYFNIFLDEPSYIFQTLDINTLYQKFTKSDTQTFIWLGI